MTVRSALRAIRRAGPWRVISLANGRLLVESVGRKKMHEMPGVLASLHLAQCLETAINGTKEAPP